MGCLRPGHSFCDSLGPKAVSLENARGWRELEGRTDSAGAHSVCELMRGDRLPFLTSVAGGTSVLRHIIDSWDLNRAGITTVASVLF